MIGIVEPAHVGHDIARFRLLLHPIGLQGIGEEGEGGVGIERLDPLQGIGHLRPVGDKHGIARDMPTAREIGDRLDPLGIAGQSLIGRDERR